MKIVSIVGARPQFIKCGVLSRELRKHHEEILVHTNQHYDYFMNKVFFDELDIPEPDYNLGVGSGSHGAQTGKMLHKIEQVLVTEKPDTVLVYGDTNSTLAGALAASKLHLRIAHVEAGLRSYDKSMPEEINRVLTDYCADLLFCPTQNAVDNLAKEGIIEGVYNTGDVMVDAILYARQKVKNPKKDSELNLKSKDYLLVTIHRASTTDVKDNLKNIVDALCQIGKTIVFPAHPRTVKQLKAFGLYDKLASCVRIIEPLGYLDFITLLDNSKKVITDSGGVQKEAYLFQIPCMTLRDTTEWPETVKTGWNVLVGTDVREIVERASIGEPYKEYKPLFGIGACREIAKILEDRER